MFYDITIILAVLHAILLFTGSAGSLFILMVQFLDWLKSHPLEPIDFIIVSIAFANLFLQGSFFFNAIIVPWLLVLFNVVSWTVALPSYWDMYRPSPFPTDNATHVQITYNLNFKSRCDCVFYIYMALSGVAFTIIVFTAGAIIKSLHKHVTEIKKNNEGVRPARISAHISAARTVISLLILYLIFYGGLNAIFTEIRDVGSVFFSVIFITVSTFPTANAVILIFGNRKLSNKLRYVLGVKSVSGNTEVSVTT